MGAVQPAVVKAWGSLVRAKAEIGRGLHRELGAHGLAGVQLGILRVLAESSGDGVKLNEISQRLYVTPGNLTGLVDRLEEAGYLRRAPCSGDRRATLAVLTPAGRRLFEQVHPLHVSRITQVMSALTLPEQKLLTSLLTRLADRATELREQTER